MKPKHFPPVRCPVLASSRIVRAIAKNLRDARPAINDRCYAAETVTTLGEFAEKV
jgi:hypothetical protein